jgi:acetate---CoA ligase (ADP-forming)
MNEAKKTEEQDLTGMFCARRIAIVGASSDPAKIGGKPLQFLTGRFTGEIVPINPNRQEIAGLPCKPSVAEAGKGIDLAIIAVPARLVEQSVRDCLAAGIRHIVLFAAGFGEIDAAGVKAQEQLADLCRGAGARLLGPNSLGFMNFRQGLYATFSAALDNVWPDKGDIGIASQSGAVGTYLMALMAERGLGLSHFIATGNEADVDVADCISWLADDEQTRTIVAYLEGCRDGSRLRQALEKARQRGKPVIAIKPGSTDSGQAAVQSHTGMLAGSKRVFDMVLQECGAWPAETIEEAVDIAAACVPGLFPVAPEATVITPSGGVGIMLADDCTNAGIALPGLDEMTAREIHAILPLASTFNPVDTTAQVSADISLFGKVVEIVTVGSPVPIHFIFMAHMGKTPAVTEILRPVLEAIAARNPGKLFVLILRASDDFREDMSKKGFLVFEEPSRAVRAVRALLFFGAAFSRTNRDAVSAALPELPPFSEIVASSDKAFRMLRHLGLSTAESAIAANLEQAEIHAKAIGFPVVLKIESPDIQHKSDVGGVVTSITDPAALATAWKEIMETVRQAMPDARITGCSVSAMAGNGIDTIIGLKRDTVFGPVIAFGVGGIFTEVLDDVAILPAPVSPNQAQAMIKRLRARPLFEGSRGTRPVDIAALAEDISAVSRLACRYGNRLESLEINPYRLTPEGGIALDILVLPSVNF